MHRPPLSRPALLIALLFGLPWSASFLWQAFEHWRYAVACAMACPAYIDADLAPAHFRSMDWQGPLLLAALPLMLAGAGWVSLRRRAMRRG